MRTLVPSLVLALALILAACAQDTPAAEAGATTSTTSPTTSTAPAPSTTEATTTTSSTSTTTTLATGSTTLSADGTVLISENIPFTSQLTMDVLTPTTPGAYPVVIMFHGGGWVGGDPDEITPLATAIAAGGAVVFNAPYRLALRGGGYPTTLEDASCAVRFARERALEFGGNPAFVTVVGYSAGAHIGAVTALAGDSFTGDCNVESGSSLPDAFVGVAGPYDTDLLDPLMSVFFGTDRAKDPVAWEDGNPHTHIGENPNLIVRLIQGELDPLVPVGFSIAFNDDLLEAGYNVELTIIKDGTHGTVVDPLADGDAVVAAVLALSG
ncbi:MAG: alpha/beta hydrolase [Acidimicrobiia bacterium]|nr:alpha/beta hydrolase [Acidimicrobiia bacterium]